ncbi:ATPase [Antarcticimicrobium sediminis]|uniref:histidine kinase n=2 Tax=Antarcticimicrobium sediminis TaxID=2546227 RepID=A0A4R5ESE4_9RHOB|nr:ATPase [Antarcticimicrobium sediminis]
MPSHHSARLFQTVILILFLGLSYLSFVLVHTIAQSRSEESFQVLADQILTSVDRRLEGYGRILDGVSGLVMASDVVTAADMEVYAKSLDIPGDLFVLDAIGLTSAGSADTGTGDGGFTHIGGMSQLSTASPGLAEDDFIVQYVEPLAAHEKLVGLNFTSNSELMSVAKRSREAGETLATMHFPGRSLQNSHSQIFLLKPIYQSSQDAKVFLGFAFAVLNIENAFKNLTPSQDKFLKLHVESGADSFRDPLEIMPASTTTAPGYVHRQSIEKFGQTFSLSMSSTPQFEAIQPFRARWIVLALGLFITALVSATMHVLIKKNIAISAAVTQKSRDLETQIQENRCILENAMLPIVSVSKTGQIIHCNEAALKLLAHLNGPANMDGKMINDLLPNFDMQGADGWSKVVISPRTGPSESSTIEIEKKTWFTADGEERVALLMRDITVSERLTQEIAEAEQRWNLALMSAEIGVFDICLETRTSVVSDIWLKTLKIPPLPGCNNPYQQQMAKIHPDDLAILKNAEDHCIKGHTERATARFRVNVEKDEWRWIETDAVVVKRAPDGTALRMLGIQKDVTERFKLEQMKRDFVATVSHELRTPLTSIKGAIGLLQAQLKGVEISGVDRLVYIASSNSDRLLSLVNDILDLEKLNAGRMKQDLKAVNLNEIMTLASKQVEPYASQWNVEVEVVEHEVDRHIWADKKRVIQIISNLLSNACKFSDTGTAVRLTAEVMNAHTKISVSNFGPGIPEKFRSTIFQPFSQADNSDTRQRGGTGLGLSISRRLIEDMGGTVGFESEPGKETVFWFTCPLADDLEIVRVA